MAKKIDINELETPSAPKSSSDRQARWDAYLARYASENPVKYAAKKANKEFDVIPSSFK